MEENHNTVVLDIIERKESDWTDLIQETEEKAKMIKERLKVAIDRQKSYADMKRKDI